MARSRPIGLLRAPVIRAKSDPGRLRDPGRVRRQDDWLVLQEKAEAGQATARRPVKAKRSSARTRRDKTSRWRGAGEQSVRISCANRGQACCATGPKFKVDAFGLVGDAVDLFDELRERQL
jgi:hypothetical protein